MSDLEQTQAIHLEDYDEETDEEVGNGEKKIVMISSTCTVLFKHTNIVTCKRCIFIFEL